MTSEPPAVFRSGFCSLVGRPNAGKSTLTNAMVGAKVAITSTRPQTTRHVVRGVVHRPRAQLVLLDTPGLHKPRTLLGQRLVDLVHETLADVDVVGLCVAADAEVGPGDRMIAAALAPLRAKRVAVLTKTDTVGRERVAEQLLALSALAPFDDVVPTSARDGFQVELLADVLFSHLPPGPPLYPGDQLTDSPLEHRVAELVREAALEGVRDELPHSLAVVVDEIVPRQGRPPGRELTDVRVHVFVERDSQRAIVVGAGGTRLRDVGTQARTQIEELMGTRVYLDLHVKVAKDWQRDPRQLNRLGF